MASLKFNRNKSHILNSENIEKYVGKIKIGNYALGSSKKNKFIPKYVGRSDTDLNSRLKNHLNESYKRFKFIKQTSSKNAFLKECENYHDFKKQLDNKIHPGRPTGLKWKCPKKNCNE